MTPMLRVLAAEDKGFHVPTVTHLFGWEPLFSFSVAGFTFHVTTLMLVMLATTALLSVLFVSAFSRARVVPTGLQNVMEAGIGFVRENIVLPTIGPEGDKWLPYLTTLFFFVFGLNFLEVVPVIQFPVTSHMAFPALLAMITWVTYNFVGIREQGFIGYFRGMLFPPGVPKPIYLILTPVEFLSTLVFRPVTLAVRLFANMMAGHVMLTIFFLASAYFLWGSDALLLKPLAVGPIVLSIVLVGFEVFVGAIQAFIFTILTAVYIAGASHPEH
ncbi:MAG TPA: F0F1 ATP synthase subunit A [Actinomycetota bacterium]|nr:F0F1 ATP synthase subunit A [Actinomycetota bacterium]